MKEELLKELKDAMIKKDELRKDTITLLRAAILQIEKDEQKNLTQNEMEIIVSKEVKKRKESMPDFEKAGRQDIVDNLNKEIEVLSKYLSKQLSEKELEEMIDETIERLGVTSPREMGLIMKDLKPKIAGKADGKLVSELVNKKLNK